MPKVETIQPKPLPVVEAPKIEPKQPISSYNFNYELNQIGGLPLSDFDISFLNKNIGDIADYYYNSVKNLYSNQNIYINSFGIQKQDSVNYLISFFSSTQPQSKQGKSNEQYNNKFFKLTRINERDGNFELTNLNAFKYEVNNSNINYPTDLIEAPIHTDGPTNNR